MRLVGGVWELVTSSKPVESLSPDGIIHELSLRYGMDLCRSREELVMLSRYCQSDGVDSESERDPDSFAPIQEWVDGVEVDGNAS